MSGYWSRNRCILSKFYIKPQQAERRAKKALVVSYRNSTSNHNLRTWQPDQGNVVSYRNSTSNHNYRGRGAYHLQLYLIEILHQTTTYFDSKVVKSRLYLIEILHQTTTSNQLLISESSLYLIEILHQTTTYQPHILLDVRCILSKFYIKPQRSAMRYQNW